MKTTLLAVSVAALALSTLPVLAQNNAVSITGSQETDFPSSRANVSETGSFVRPKDSFDVSQKTGQYRNRSARVINKTVPITGDQETDFPSGRAGFNESGSFVHAKQ